MDIRLRRFARNPSRHISATMGARTVLLVVLGLTGCGEEAAEPDVELEPGDPIAVGSSPTVDLGVVAGAPEQIFHGVGNPFSLDDDRIVVPLVSEPEIRIFDRSDRLIRTLGGPGEGPGEFATISAVWARGDTVVAIDARQSRMTRFPPDGEPEVVGLDAPGSLAGAPPGVLGEGISVATYGRFAAGDAATREELVLHAVSREGAHLGDLATVGNFVRLGAPGVHGPHPLSPRAMLRAFEGAVYVGDSLEPRVWKVTADGNTVEVVSWEPSEIPPPAEALTAMRDALEANAESSSSSDMGLALLESGGAQPVSAFWDFQVGPRGHVWILPFDPPKHSLSLGDLGGGNTLTGGSHAADEWTVLHPDGRTIGTVAVPEGFRISQIREDEIVGVRRDPETEVEIVEVYPLERH